MKRLSLLLLFLSALTLKAQDSTLSLRVDAHATLRDAEYFMPFTKGYTMASFHLAPSFLWCHEEFSLSAGAWLTAVAGTEGFYKAAPLLTLRYQPAHWITLCMGTINGSPLTGLGMHDVGYPMYNQERFFYNPLEEGMSITTSLTNRETRLTWSSDTWLDWENFLQPWTPDQERFTLGSTHTLNFPLCPGNEMSLKASFMGSHRGGQFSTLDTCIQTLFNERIGAYWQIEYSQMLRIEPSFDAYFFQNQTPRAATLYPKGYGLYPQVAAHFHFSRHNRHLIASMGYWYGNQYLSARGSWHYQSASWHDPTYAQPLRHLLTADLHYSHRLLTQDELCFYGQAFYDLDLHAFDFALGLTITFSAHHTFRLP